MARLRQQHPQDYGSSGKIHTDIENIVRYLNSAELGNKTVSELLQTLFNTDGVFDGPIEMRLNSTSGIEYRIGEYRNAEDGWNLIANIDDIRGPSGQNLGLIEGPLFFNRQDVVISINGTTTLSYDFTPETEDIMVYKNGLLLRGTGVSPDYTYNSGTDTITLAVAVNIGTVINILSIRAGAVSNYRRYDYTAPSTVAVVPFAHTDEERLLVYKNGILQREGASYDYVKSAATDTITFLTPLVVNDVATIVTVENQAQTAVAGLMMEDEYTDGNGYINYAKLSIANNQIPQSKVTNLSTDLASKAKISISSTPPVSPVSGDLWVDTSLTPVVLKFYQGTEWLAASPDKTVPSFSSSNANQYLRVNGTGTVLEYGNIDFSSLVPKTYMGAANGVASLDSSGKIPTGQLPQIFSVATMNGYQAGAISNTTYRIGTIYKQKIRIDGISAVLSSGTCTIQLAVDGVVVGSTYAVSNSRINNTISPVIEVDGTTTARVIQVVVTSNAAGNNLDVAISTATLNA